jgi:hypothetical protein
MTKSGAAKKTRRISGNREPHQNPLTSLREGQKISRPLNQLCKQGAAGFQPFIFDQVIGRTGNGRSRLSMGQN